MSSKETLASQDWERITMRLTYFAFKRVRKKSWALAEELAQEAIARAFEEKDGWDPAKGPLFKYLATEVIGLALNEWRRRRNRLEVAMFDGEEDDMESNEALERAHAERQYVETLLDKTKARMEHDAIGTKLLALMREGVLDANDQAEAASLEIAEVRKARRRLFDHAERAANELEGDMT